LLSLVAALEELLPESSLGSFDLSVPLRFIRLNLILFDFFAALIVSVVDPLGVLTGVELFSASSEPYQAFPPPHPKDAASALSHME
jgi:hypothetical protein